MRSYGLTNAAPYATAPAVGAAGDTYYNTASKLLYMSDGTIWNAVSSGAASAANYWFGQMVASQNGAALANDTAFAIGWTTTTANGFTLAGSGQRITPSVAGRYQVTAQVSIYGGANGSLYCRGYIQSFTSGGTLKQTVRNLGTGSAGGAYGSMVIDGQLDILAGDYIMIYIAAGSATATVNADSWCSVVPVGGGFKGDPGSTVVPAWATPPGVGVAGSQYFNTTTGMLYVSDGAVWKPVADGSGVPSFSSAPAVGAVGAEYYNTASKTMYESDGSAWRSTAAPRLLYATTNAGAWGPTGLADLAFSSAVTCRAGCWARFQAVVPVTKQTDGNASLELVITNNNAVVTSVGTTLFNGWAGTLVLDYWATSLAYQVYKIHVGANVGTVASQSAYAGSAFSFTITEWPTSIPA